MIQIGTEQMPSILKNPFSKILIESIRVSYRKNIFAEEWIASGTVEFKNGNTSGKQEFNGNDFNDVVSQIKIFIETI